MKTFLFQGDSITAIGRSEKSDDALGWGYVNFFAASIACRYPGEFKFLNRGICGNRSIDIYKRIKRDIINIKPDVMSILVGINDVWHDTIDSPNGVDGDKYYKIYDMLITEIKEALPEIKIMIMEPFVLKIDSIEANWEYIERETKIRSQMAQKIASKHGLTYIGLQDGFSKLTACADAKYWLSDGVHPTPMGHEYIKTQWIKAFKENILKEM